MFVVILIHNRSNFPKNKHLLTYNKIKKKIPQYCTTSFKQTNILHRKKVIDFFTLVYIITNIPHAVASVQQRWEVKKIPMSTVLFDIDFSHKSSLTRGWIVGTQGTFLETINGGKNWVPRNFKNLDLDEELMYRFEVISFFENNGWILGKPMIMLYTEDDGNTWKKIPISPKLPGEPRFIKALGLRTAEMVTSSGAIYLTENGGKNWKACIKETIDSTLNRTISSGISGASYFTGSVIGISRDVSGKYIAISSRGNFFLTWEHGQDFWVPRARDTSRRIQSMGFIQQDVSRGIWMATKGGSLSFAQPSFQFGNVTPFQFFTVNIKTGGYGILDLSFRNKNEIWTLCGGGNLYVSYDSGETWKKEKKNDEIVGSLYKIKFFSEDLGFILGSNGILLKYII